MKYAFLLLLLFPALIFARGTYQEPVDFVAQAFSQQAPKPSAIWVTGEVKAAVKEIMGHTLPSLRQRYWGHAGRTAWILEEIGKEKPITVGIVVNQNKIESVSVLVFRESRGSEVRYPFFTEQFINGELNEQYKLDKTIDGISGATLSVHALKKVVTLALYLHQQTPFSHSK